MDADPNLSTFVAKKPQFKSLSKEKKDDIMRQRKAENTNIATKLWIGCFSEYLTEKQLKPIEELDLDSLPPILTDFYTEITKKGRGKIGQNQASTSGEGTEIKPDPDADGVFDGEYKNSSNRQMYAGCTQPVL